MGKEIMPIEQTPPDLHVAIIANLPRGMITREIVDACDTAQLVISLGNVDLETLASRLHPKKLALCVLGSDDAKIQPPPPFRALHGNGVAYKGWKIAGLSGGNEQLARSSRGMNISNSEADLLLENVGVADILLTHTPPAYLPKAPNLRESERGFEAIADYIDAALPAYCLFASDEANDVRAYQWEDDGSATLLIGVNGLYVPPPLAFF